MQLEKSKARLVVSDSARVRAPTIRAFHAAADPAKPSANGEASSHAPSPTLICAAARGPDTIGTLSVATTMQVPTIQAFAELASSPKVPKNQGAMNRYAPSNTVAHLRRLGVNTFMPNLREWGSARDGAVRGPPSPRLEQELAFALELPDPLSRQLELRSELCERQGIPVVESVAPHQDVACFLR